MLIDARDKGECEIVFTRKGKQEIDEKMSGILESIMAQHAKEAAFLWLQRESATRESHYSLNDLTKLDGRVEAHLDNLRIAGEPGGKMCKDALGLKEPGEVFEAEGLAFERGDLSWDKLFVRSSPRGLC